LTLNSRSWGRLTGIGKIVACGLNYRGHAKEMGSPFPPNPLFFGKAPSAIAGPYDDLLLPPPDWSKEVDYEVELGIIIGSQCRGVSVQDAPAYIAGYTIVNDMTARDIQRAESQWFRAKSYDGFCPIGPYLVTRDEIDNPDALALSTHINGEMRQQSSTSDMIFSTAEIVSFASMSMTLEPGDIIATGTPAGIGGGMKPPRFLQPGDVIEMKVEGLGEQRVRVIGGEE
jgi:2,4-didehydro-3-deoxy-L-rhamnonate hydrolase